jgi:hypothetical protein
MTAANTATDIPETATGTPAVTIETTTVTATHTPRSTATLRIPTETPTPTATTTPRITATMRPTASETATDPVVTPAILTATPEFVEPIQPLPTLVTQNYGVVYLPLAFKAMPTQTPQPIPNPQ